jgi:hypothetical protein
MRDNTFHGPPKSTTSYCELPYVKSAPESDNSNFHLIAFSFAFDFRHIPPISADIRTSFAIYSPSRSGARGGLWQKMRRKK